jgi:hypothetical protein
MEVNLCVSVKSGGMPPPHPRSFWSRAVDMAGTSGCNRPRAPLTPSELVARARKYLSAKISEFGIALLPRCFPLLQTQTIISEKALILLGYKISKHLFHEQRVPLLRH